MAIIVVADGQDSCWNSGNTTMAITRSAMSIRMVGKAATAIITAVRASSHSSRADHNRSCDRQDARGDGRDCFRNSCKAVVIVTRVVMSVMMVFRTVTQLL